MIDNHDIDTLLNNNADVYDKTGDKVGSLSQIYLDDATGQPSWATVNTGLFGMSESFVPLEGSSVRGEDLHVGYTKDQIKDAPKLDEDQHLEPQDEDRLYEYYAMQGTGRADAGHTHDEKRTDTPVPHNTRRSAADSAVDAPRSDDDSMTLSEERVNVGTERHETGRVRLRKHVVTENVTRTVPVEREEVVIERVPADGSDTGHIDADGETAEVTLHEERPVVEKETVAVEEVHVGKKTVTDQETVSAEVRKEQLDTDEDRHGQVGDRPER